MKILILTISLLLVGCATQATNEVASAQELIKYQSGSSFHHLFYMGSDEKFHYIFRRSKTITNYKVPKEQVNFKNEFPYKNKEGKPYILLPGTIEEGIKRKKNML